MNRIWIIVSLAPLSGLPAPSAPPCQRLERAGTQIQGEVKICPGRYRLPDPTEKGVIIIAASRSRLDLTGVTIESGDSTSSRFVGIGIVSRGVDRVEIVGGTVRGYRYGIRLEGGRGHLVSGTDVSGSRNQHLLSTPDSYNEQDWLDIFHPDTFDTYGSGLLLKWTDGATIIGITARNGQNGIGLFGARGSYLAENDVSSNTGWGIHLWQASHNTIVRNVASNNVRCESASYSHGCDSAGLLLRERSDSNFIADNDLTHSGDGFFLSGHRPLVQPSIGNLVIRNNATGAYHNAFESTFSAWNVFLENRADSSAYGFWLGYSTGNTVRGNTMVGTRIAGIAIEHGSDNEIAANVIIGGRMGIRLFAPQAGQEASTNYRVHDNTIARVTVGMSMEKTTHSKIRGNLFDAVGDGLTVDEAGSDAELSGNIFLRADRMFIRAPHLDAGGNFWGTANETATGSRVEGQVNLKPWRPASAAGY
ncbi:MAG: NosD domain-containing protein [Gemmatimonadota bacterium]